MSGKDRSKKVKRIRLEFIDTPLAQKTLVSRTKAGKSVLAMQLATAKMSINQ